MKDDPFSFEHIGEVRSTHQLDGLHHSDDAVTLEQYKNPKAVVHRPQSPHFAATHHDGYKEPSRELLDPTLGYVMRACLVSQADMMLGSESASENVNSVASTAAAPTYSINQSRLNLYAAFPPPPIILPSKDHVGSNARKYNSQELNLAKQRLKRHSGLYGAVGIASATREEFGYVDTTVSLNYRLPRMLYLPTPTRTPMVGNAHCNLQMGSNTNQSFGGTLSDLDGTTSLCLDVGNPFSKPSTDLLVKNGILASRFDRRHYTICATRHFNSLNQQMRIQGVVQVGPLPLLSNQIIYGKHYGDRAVNGLHVEQFGLVLSNFGSHQAVQSPKQRNKHSIKDRINVNMSLGYGKGSTYWYNFPESAVYVPDIDITRDSSRKGSPTHQSAHSASIKVDMEQRVSSSQTCQYFIQYRHLGHSLSLGTTITRTFSSSPFSRLGVGIRYMFDNMWTRKLWKQGRTWWLFRLERGDATLCIPVAIYPAAVTTWESCIRIFFASVTSLVIDAIVAELLCGVTSILRVKFLQFILGKDCIDEDSILESMHETETRRQQEEKRWTEMHIANARENALKQRDVMEKQAKRIAKDESDRGGLVIVKAVYGVMDGGTHKWIPRRNGNGVAPKLCALNATTQLQFWVNDGSLHMPAVSKKNMLGFYDVLACVRDEDRRLSDSDTSEKTNQQLSFYQKAFSWFTKQWKESPKLSDIHRDLRVVLFIQYKWEDKLYEVMFEDDEAVELPSPRAREEVHDTKINL
jgi:hypothetical protein